AEAAQRRPPRGAPHRSGPAPQAGHQAGMTGPERRDRRGAVVIRCDVEPRDREPFRGRLVQPAADLARVVVPVAGDRGPHPGVAVAPTSSSTGRPAVRKSRYPSSNVTATTGSSGFFSLHSSASVNPTSVYPRAVRAESCSRSRCGGTASDRIGPASTVDTEWY